MQHEELLSGKDGGRNNRGEGGVAAQRKLERLWGVKLNARVTVGDSIQDQKKL